MTRPMRARRTLEGAERVLAVLELLAEGAPSSGSAVAAELAVGRATAHRLLSTLVAHGYAHQDPATRHYGPGPALLELGRGVLGRSDVGASVWPMFEAVARRTGETVHIGVLDGRHVRYLESIDSPAVLRVSTRDGHSGPAHGTSLGRALLATLSDDEITRRFPGEQLPALLSGRLGTRTSLMRDIRRVRRLSYAENRGDVEANVASVSVAVPRLSGPLLGMSVSGPVSRMTRERVRDFAAVLLAERRRLGGEAEDSDSSDGTGEL